MRQMKPRVSIGMPCYNGEKFLEASISSMLAQTFTDFELIISDNASTDATEQICRRFAAQDPRVRYYRNERNIGANANFNRVVELSSPSAVYFRWAAHDDVCAPTYLERCVHVLDNDRTAVLCHTRTKLIDIKGRELTPDDLARIRSDVPPQDPYRSLGSIYPQERFGQILLLTRWCFEIFGVIRKEALLRTWLQEDYYGTDKVILATLSLLGPFREVPEPLFLRRCHNTQSTSIRSAAARAVWSDPNSERGPVIPQLPCLQGYVRAATKATLFPLERVECWIVLAQYLLQWRKLASLARSGVQQLLGAATAPNIPSPLATGPGVEQSRPEPTTK